MPKPKISLKCASDYILIRPDKPKGGAFDAGDTYIDETGFIEDVGPATSDAVKKMKGKKVLFNAWACDQKTVQGNKYYFTPESANAICATL